MRLVLWQPFLSLHQEGFYHALAKADWVDSLILRVESELPETRRASGWRDVNTDGLRVENISHETVPENDPDTVHLFTGFETHAGIWSAFRRLTSPHACRVFAYTEAPDLTGFGGKLRSLKYRLTAQKLSQGLDGVLAIGGNGLSFYRTLLQDRCPVHAFGYYDGLDISDPDAVPSPGSSGVCRLLYTGQLIPRKGLDRLFGALAPLADQSWTLKLVGSGPEEAKLKRLADTLKITGHLHWEPAKPHAELLDEYHKADSLILPSRWDGWGMAVNEALRAGCPVRATAACGAASLLPAEWILQEPGPQWTESLMKLIEQVSHQPDRNLALKLARKTSGDYGAGQLRDILAVSR